MNGYIRVPKRILLVTLMATLLTATFAAVATGARADGPPLAASGSFSLVHSNLSTLIITSHLFFQVHNTITFTGTLSGTALCHASGGLDLATGRGAFTCDGSFTGAAGPVSGTFVFRAAGTITGPTAQGHFTLTSSEGSVGQFSFVQNQDCAHPVVGCLAGSYTGHITLDS